MVGKSSFKKLFTGVAVASETAGGGFVRVLEGEGTKGGGVLSLKVPADGSKEGGGGMSRR